MNYVEWHFGDYARDTAHLSMIEDGAYRRLLDLYYTREAPLPADADRVCKLARAFSRQERAAIVAVLAEFFTLTPDGFRNARCDTEITRVLEKQEKARRSAQARWNHHGPQSGGNASADANADAPRMRTHAKRNAPSNQTPVAIASHPSDAPISDATASVASPPKKLGGETLPACPIERIIERYHERLPALPRVLVRNATRDGYIRSRWREVFADGKASDSEDGVRLFDEFFEHVGNSKFLIGGSSARNGSPPFVADLEWLMRPTNFAKVVEGRYHRDK